MNETSERIKSEEYIHNLCFLYLASENDEKNRIGEEIYKYCHDKYYRIITTYGMDRDDVFDEVMCKLYYGLIDSYIRKSRSNTFESFFMLTARGEAYRLANEKVGKNTAYLYSKIKSISDKYCIPIDVDNSYKFSKLLGANDNYSINKIISAIEGYMQEVSLEAGRASGAAYI